ncbi:hypothetical protein O4J56_25670 [Nocardiopsis sp. RSe5-2]|uniref:YtxH domain-containing protein n=1 Tax=Nocardiopsis endophytica TaxID=3018445 RepID=A0ABT4UAR8_9ACTN|nr:hypothetical protein [Nocardiopsis endophytica]MDA2814061.1 hypothetical protein [Nocardiopsis endophytica]
MTGRLIYLVAGAVLGGYVVHRLNRTARAWSPEGIADRVEDRVADYRAALREFNEDVHDAMEQREAELLRLYSAERSGPGGLPRPVRAQIETRGANGAPEMKDGR